MGVHIRMGYRELSATSRILEKSSRFHPQEHELYILSSECFLEAER